MREKAVRKMLKKVAREEVVTHFTTFQKEFRKHLATFITGAFAFVAALLWRDAIVSLLERYQAIIRELTPWKEMWVIQFVTAFLVSIVAVAAIVIVSKLLGVGEK